MAHIHDDLSVWGHIEMSSIHRSRSRTFEVDSLAVVAAAVAGALEFVLGWLPIGSAA